jgi:hypothetical protein
VIEGWVIFGLLASSAGECPAAAVLEGDETLVRTVQARLEARGLASEPLLGCDAVRVSLAAHGDQIAMQIAAGESQPIARSAHDASEAATIIESWARTDVAAPLLEHELPPRPPLRPAAPDEKSPQQTPTDDAPPLVEPRPFAIGASAAAGLGSDGSKWFGIDIRGCFLVWRVCLGGRFQPAFELRGAGDFGQQPRLSLDFMATADLPLVLDFLEVAPGFGIGQSILRSERTMTNPVDGPPLVVEDDTSGFKLRAQLGAGFRVARHWSARLELALDYTPFAERVLRESVVEGEPENIAIEGEVPLTAWLRAGLELGGL